MAGRPSNKKELGVWMNGIFVGNWTFSSASGHAFAYSPSWIASPLSRPISLSLPLTKGTEKYSGNAVESFFDNLLPDSLGIRKRLASKFGAESTQAFQLLEKIGRDCVGALQLLPIDSEPVGVHRIEAESLAEKDIERILDDTVSNQNMGVPHEEDELRISLAGAQEKTALLWHGGKWCRPHGTTPTTHILKLPLGEVGGMRADFSTSVENEWLCGKILQAYGLPVADSTINTFGRHKVLVVTRFDRRLITGKTPWWARLPQEDFCQVTGTAPERKYEEKGGPGISKILNLLRGSDNAAGDRLGFMTTQLLFWMLAAPDGHGKNFSIFIKPKGRFELTPLYDVMSAWPVIGKGARQFQWQKVKLAMALHSKNTHYHVADIQRRHWNMMAKDNAVGADFEETINRIVNMTPGVIDTVSKMLPKDFPSKVSGKIFEGMTAQAKRISEGYQHVK